MACDWIPAPVILTPDSRATGLGHRNQRIWLVCQAAYAPRYLARSRKLRVIAPGPA
jgi:hypothetical protein